MTWALPPVMSGAERIAAERQRQITQKGWTPEHDDRHSDGSLVDAAVVYASPRALYVKSQSDFSVADVQAVAFIGLWPHDWEYKPKTRCTDGHGLDSSKVMEINTATPARRIRELEKAGALIAAEIDRLERASS